MAKTNTRVTGAAGEHLVMGELLRRGYIAALAPQGAPNMDILIADESGQRLFSIQVKTRLTKSGWPMSLKHESISVDRLFYVFVDLSGSIEKAPEYFVMPSSKVAWVVKENHAAWLRNPGTGGKKRNDSERRVIKPDYSAHFTSESVDPRLNDGWMEEYRSGWHVFENV